MQVRTGVLNPGMRRTSSRRLLELAPDIVILLFLVAAAGLAARNFVPHSLYIWGDHPGQFMRFWYPAAVSLPQYGRVVDWNPLWYAGYPELQFYPPGHALLGLALNALTLGRLSLERVYNLIPAIALVLPVFTTFAFLRISLAPAGRWAARVAGLTAAALALTFTPMWGGANAVPIGMMGERLAFGTVPLVLLAGWRLVERPTGGRLALGAALLAALILFHPFHAPAAVIAVSGYALARWLLLRLRQAPEGESRARWPWLVGWVVLAAGFTAWWLVPLLARQSPYSAAMVRATFAQTSDSFKLDGDILNFVIAAVPALALLAHRDWRVRSTVSVLALLIPALVLVVVFDYVVLFDRLNITALDPIRFIAEYYLAFILLVGAAAGAVVSRWAWRFPPLGAALAILLVVGLRPIAIQARADLPFITSVPQESTSAGLFQHPAFAGLWETLANDPLPGRVLFTSYYMRLSWPNGFVTPTTVKAMTPYLTGREIMGGTFSHWSPGARLLWVGDPWVSLLPAQVEHEDDQRMLGIPWGELTDATLLDAARELNITTIVADMDDPKARNMLDAAPHFERFWENEHFVLYHVMETAPAWVEGNGAQVSLVERDARRWVIQVDRAELASTLTAKMAFYPLWRAAAGDQQLAVTSNPYGMQQVELPAGGPYTVTLAYREGGPEWAGLIATLATAAAAALLWLRGTTLSRRTMLRPNAPPS